MEPGESGLNLEIAMLLVVEENNIDLVRANNPTPEDDGLECLVSSEGNIRGPEQTEYKICNTKLCSGKIN